jgi:transposase
LCALFDVDDGGGAAAGLSVAGNIQRLALHRKAGRSLAHDAARPATSGSGVPTNRRWIKASCLEAMAHDLRAIVRLALERKADPSAVIMDSRTLQSTPESGARAGFDGHKKRKGSKVHAAVNTLGHLLALVVTTANEQDRAQVGQLAKAVHTVVEEPAADAAQQGIQLEVVKHHEAKHGFVLLPRRWVVERSFAWLAITNGFLLHWPPTIGWHLSL